MRFNKYFSILFREWSFILIGILLLFNVFLLCKLSNLRVENETWRSKMNLSIAEQIAILEHELEGVDMRDEIIQFQRKNIQANRLINNTQGYILFYLFKNLTCDSCLNTEMLILNKYREIFKKLGVDIVIVFTEVNQDEYMTFTKLFRIKDISIWEEEPVFSEILNGIRSPAILFLSHSRHILAANISDWYRDEYKSERFFKKIMIFF